MDISIIDIPGMTESHRGLVDYCFNVAFAADCEPSRMGDVHLAALLSLRIRIISNFGLYVLANPDTGITPEALLETMEPLISEALSRTRRCQELSEDRTLLVKALSECRSAGCDSGETHEEIARFVSDAARARSVDGRIGLAVLQAVGTNNLSAVDRAFALKILRGWISSMAPDGSWPGLPDREALERCRMLADVAIPGYMVHGELIDSCYRRYAMKEKSADLTTELQLIAARCAHYTDIEVDYADADIAFLVDALNGDIPAEMRIDACTAMFDVLLQLYALDLMEIIDFDSGHDPGAPGTEYPRA
ncbi:MAG: hypothetical protein K2K05_10745 [Muribaculaceae bacterium]|nr:hypothetical protein [Muribaculaceae bacterium]